MGHSSHVVHSHSFCPNAEAISVWESFRPMYMRPPVSVTVIPGVKKAKLLEGSHCTVNKKVCLMVGTRFSFLGQ